MVRICQEDTRKMKLVGKIVFHFVFSFYFLGSVIASNLLSKNSENVQLMGCVFVMVMITMQVPTLSACCVPGRAVT